MPRVVLRTQVAAPAELLWQTVKGFASVADWNPLVRDIEADGDGVGALRKVALQGIGEFVERLEQRDEAQRRYSYAIVDSPLPVRNCTVEVQVGDNGDGTATVEWRSRFETDPPAEFQAVKSFQQVYQNALDHLEAKFAGAP